MLSCRLLRYGTSAGRSAPYRHAPTTRLHLPPAVQTAQGMLVRAALVVLHLAKHRWPTGVRPHENTAAAGFGGFPGHTAGSTQTPDTAGVTQCHASLDDVMWPTGRCVTSHSGSSFGTEGAVQRAQHPFEPRGRPLQSAACHSTTGCACT